MFENIVKNHISLLCNKNIKEICLPFFNQYNLNHLNYIRVYKDNSVFYLCSNYEWLKHYYQQAYPTIGAFEQNPDLRNYRYVLWAGLDKGDKILEDSRCLFDVPYGITIINNYPDYSEFYNIGSSSKNPRIVNFFINNFDILLQFCETFKDKASKLMRASCSQRILLSSNTQGCKQEIFSKGKSIIHKENSFTNVHLTNAEQLCIKLLLAGNSPLEIAKMLGISKRTVEKHIENVKLKFNCKKQLHLGYALAKAGFELE